MGARFLQAEGSTAIVWLGIDVGMGASASLGKHPLDPAVGIEPHERDRGVHDDLYPVQNGYSM